MQRKIFAALETVAKLVVLEMNEEDFLPEVFYLALQLIPKACCGAAILVEKEGGRIIAVHGHNPALIGLRFLPEDILRYSEVTLIKDILHLQRDPAFSKEREKLVALSQPIAETILAPLYWDGELFGQITLDIVVGRDVHFEETDLEIMRRLGAVASAFHGIRKALWKEGVLLEKIIFALVGALEYYDPYTRGHSENSARYALEIGKRLNLTSEDLRRLYFAALIHAVGKIFIPQEILRKPTRLTEEEYDLIKLHPVKGEALLSEVKDLHDIARIIRHHHERFDGKGYPDVLKGEEIPLESRILAVVDAFEAMTSERPYRPSLSLHEALEELKRCAGTQFDPLLVKVMVNIIEEENENLHQPFSH